MTMKFLLRAMSLAVILWSAAPAAAVQRPAPYEVLRAAFAARSASHAASAFTAAATVRSESAGQTNVRRTREAIALLFASAFDSAAMGPIDLNFRRTSSIVSGSGLRDTGYFRIRRPGRNPVFGRYTTDLRRDADGTLRISRAGLRSATEEQFEEARGPVLFEADSEELSAYYNRFLGRYRRPDGCDVVITKTLRRLWARDVCTHQWRSLSRRAGREWTAGSRVISAEAVTRFRFEGVGGQVPRRLRIDALEGGAGPMVARRVEPYRIEQLSFRSADGTQLAGQIWVPTANSRRIGIALAHGSGRQDRNGYASFLAVLADQLATQGYTVVTYDKRGSGGSGGDWTRASFATLADDLSAAAAALRVRSDLVDPAGVGIGGSSQAGWISAKAVERGAAPAFVFLVGAGGSAMPVTVQNRYNVGVTMRCAGFREEQIAVTLDQNEAFYAFRRDPAAARTLDDKTAQAARDPAIADWLLPDSRSVDASGGAWYSVMEIDFDPLPIWQTYSGPLIFVQGDQDDQTPAAVVRERLAGLDPRRVALHILVGGQHVGLRARDVCEGARLEDLNEFHPGLFDAITVLDSRLQGIGQRGAVRPDSRR